GVAAVLGPDDVPAEKGGDVIHDEPILAQEVVRYVGEPIALVAAESFAEARAAASQVRVEYEPLPPAITLEAALAEGAPEIHAGEPNIREACVIERGDVEAVFARAAHVVETKISSHRVHQGYIELRCAMAEIDPDDMLTVTMTSQAPFLVRRSLARLFDLPM